MARPHVNTVQEIHELGSKELLDSWLGKVPEGHLTVRVYGLELPLIEKEDQMPLLKSKVFNLSFFSQCKSSFMLIYETLKLVSI